MLLFLACVPDDAPPEEPTGSFEEDTAPLEGITVSLATIPTVLVMSGQTERPVQLTATAVFGDGEEVSVQEAATSTDHALTLVGVPADTTAQVQVVTDDLDGFVQLYTTTITTGSNPAWVPEITAESLLPDAVEPGFLLAPLIRDLGGGVLAVDSKGRVVWAWPQDDEGLDYRPTRARLSLDGTRVLFFENAWDVTDEAQIRRVSLDGASEDAVPVIAGHTDFVEYTPGGYLALGWEIRLFDRRQIQGDSLLEVAPDGTLRRVWSVFDSFKVDLSHTWPSYYPADTTVEDWSHINGLTYDEDADEALMTATFNYGVLAVNRSDSVLDWMVSDYQGGDFTNTDDEVFVANPHSVQRVDDGILVFSRGEPTEPDSCSEAVELSLDFDAMEAQRAWDYGDPDCVLVSFLGHAQRLSGGNTVISWTTAGLLDEVTGDGTLANRTSLPAGIFFGLPEHVPSF